MLETILNDVLAVLRSTFLGGDWVSLAIAFGSVLIAAIVMRRGTQIGSMTLLALTLFAVGGYIRGIIGGPAPASEEVSGGVLVNQLEVSWASFMGLTAATLLAYFIAFMILIFAIFGAKTVFNRG